MHPSLRTLRFVLVLCCAAAAPAVRSSAHAPVSVPIAELTREIAARPDSLALRLARAELLRIAGDLAGARHDLDEVARRDPAHPGLSLARGALALDAGAPDEARRALDAALAARPSDPAALRLRARARLALGDRPGAILDLDAAIAAPARPSPDLCLEVARLRVAAGDAAGALAGLDAARDRIGPVPALELFGIELELESGRAEAARARLEGLRARYPDPAALAALDARIAAAGAAAVPSPAAPASAAPPPPTSAAAPAPPPDPARAAGVAPGPVLALARNSVWRYEATGTNLGATWRQPGYDDSAWPSGPGILGYGEPYITTTVPFGPDPANRYTTTYFRTTFTVGEPVSGILSLTMTANFDDGVVVYVNGVEAGRRAMPAGTVLYSTFAYGHEGGAYEPINLSSALPWLVEGTNVLAVEVHQVSPGSSDLVWDADLTYSSVPHLTRGPYLSVGTPNGMTVRWRTSGATDSRVRYGTSPASLTSQVSNAGPTTEHEVRLTDLSPATRYYYSVGTAADVLAGDSTFTFRTAPPPGSPAAVRLWAIGDSGNSNGTAYAVREAYTAWTGARGTDLWLMLGDNAYQTGTDAEFQVAVFDQYPLMLRQSPLWPTRGNHDVVRAGPNNDYYDLFTMPAAGEAGGVPSGTEAYYAFDWANIHFVCLDSEGSDRSPGGAMLTWLANDLAANTHPWVIAYWHHPPYSKGSHNSDTETQLREMRQNALPILEAGGVDLVLAGHSHSYERSKLINGHYGLSTTLTPAMIVNGGDGRPGSGGPYIKPATSPSPNAGAVYTVAGSSSQTSGGLLNHPVMVTSLNVAGSLVLDIHRNSLTARFINSTGGVQDSFMIVKSGVAGVAPDAPAVSGLRLGPGMPNPFAGDLGLSYALDRPSHVRLSVHDAAGRKVATLEEGWREAGVHAVRWDGRDGPGRPLANGVYLVTLEAHGGSVSRKIALVR